jgi:hypothetical protein
MKKSQAEKILIMLGAGWVSPLDAMRELGCMRLGARIYDLRRDGYAIEERWKESTNRFGDTVRFKEFILWKPRGVYDSATRP